MDFIPCDKVVQVELLYRWDSQTVETVLHYQAPNIPTPTNFTDLAVFIKNWYNTSMKALQHSTISLVEIKMTDLTTDISPVVDYTTGLPLAGTIGADSMPNSVALAITKRTALRGRSYRGRIYHPGLAESQCAGNQVLSASVTSLMAAYELIRVATVGSASWPMVVLSRQHNNVRLAAGVATTVIALSTDGFIDAQRRRLPGRGA
jgi:hypothetical protein